MAAADMGGNDVSRRTRRRGSNRSGAFAVLLCVGAFVGVAYGVGVVPTESFTDAAHPRGASLNVTPDERSVHELVVADRVRTNATDPLVNVTNRLGRDVTITVALRSESKDLGTLVVDGDEVGNATSFALARGAGQTVSIRVPDDDSLGNETVRFDVDASHPGLEVTAPDRGVPIDT